MVPVNSIDWHDKRSGTFLFLHPRRVDRWIQCYATVSCNVNIQCYLKRELRFFSFSLFRLVAYVKGILGKISEKSHTHIHIVFEDNRNSQRYWIYTLIITTYCVNKRGFHCALSFRWLSSSPTSIPLCLSPPYYPHFVLFFFSFYPCKSRTRYLSHTSRLPVSLLHHYTTRINWELSLESARLFYLTR